MRALILFALAAAGGAMHAKYGMWGTLNAPYQVAWINSTSGAMEKVGSPNADLFQGQQLSTYDVKGKRYYNVLYDRVSRGVFLIGTSTDPKTLGHIVVNVTLPFVDAVFVGVGQSVDMDPSTGHVIVMGQESVNGDHVILRVVAESGTYHQVGRIANKNTLDVLGAASTFDPKGQQEIVMLGRNVSGRVQLDLTMINITDGRVTYIEEHDTHYFSAVQYDPANHMVVGFGIDGTSRSVSRLDLTTLVWSHVDIKGWFGQSGGESALAPYLDGGVVYGIFQKTGVDPTIAPWNLVGIDVKSGKVVSDAILCHKVTECPWSLEFNFARA